MTWADDLEARVTGEDLAEGEYFDRETFLKMCSIFEECCRIFVKRGKKYRRSWMRYGWQDSLHHMRNKWTRIESMFWFNKPPKHVAEATSEELDSPIDLIVYTMFFIMNYVDHNERGVG